MKKYLTRDEVVFIHGNLIDEFGGLHGIRDDNSLESSVIVHKADITMTFMRKHLH